MFLFKPTFVWVQIRTHDTTFIRSRAIPFRRLSNSALRFDAGDFPVGWIPFLHKLKAAGVEPEYRSPRAYTREVTSALEIGL
jgi:hypothetical protein